MRSLIRGATLLVVLMLIVSCSALLKKKDEDAGADAAVEVAAADAAPAPPAAPALATNEGDIGRFPDEVAIGSVAATFQRSYNVREAPPLGTVVTGLPRGTVVTELASRAGYFLILFDNPKAPGTKLMGWVSRDAFSLVIPDAGPLVCPTGEIALFGDTPICGKLCSVDKDCPGGQACKGSANKLLPSGKAGDGVTVCIVYTPPPPPPVVLDAGKPPAPPVVVDAGKPPVPPVVVDAGPGPAPGPAPTADVVALPANGVCPGNFIKVNKTNKCHRPCPAGDINGSVCKNRPFFCIKCDGDTKKVCSDNREQCK